MLSVCCLSGGPPGRLSALLALLRPVADEIVVGLDERVELDRLGAVPELCDVLLRYPYAEPVERPRAWLASQCRGDWLFSIDDDEVPSAALLAALGRLDQKLTHALVPRRWLWEDGWLADDPWSPDWQLRLFRADAVSFPGVMHVPIKASGPHAYLDAPLYHLDLVVNTRTQREAKARRYEAVRHGLRLGGLPFNTALYLPELRPGGRDRTGAGRRRGPRRRGANGPDARRGTAAAEPGSRHVRRSTPTGPTRPFPRATTGRASSSADRRSR